jgi:uncharacterized protein involved in exopolysaccharide biosynthesis
MALEPQRRPNGGRNGGNGNGPGNGNANAQYAAGAWPVGGNEQFRDILHVIFKRKRTIGLLFVLVALPGLISTALQKPKYLASAKVMISTTRTDPTVQPTDVTKLDTIQLNESLVNSEVHVVGSRDLLETVVRTLAAGGDGSGPPQSGSRPFGQQVIDLSQNLTVTPIKASNIIQIDYKHSEPGTAARVVNRVVDQYLAYHAEVHGSKGLSRFYDEQRRSLEQSLRRAEDSLIEYANNEGIVSPKDEIAANVRMVAEVSGSLRDVSTAVSGAEERLRVLRDQVSSQPEVVKRSQYLEVSPVVTQLTNQLIDREVDRVSLLRKYTDKDRHVRDNGEEISELREQLNSELRERPTIVSHQLFRTNPLREDRVRQLLELEGSLSEMRARQAALEDDLSRTNRRMITLQQKGVEFDRLEQEVKNRRETYELYVKREQEARISQAMDEQKLVNVDVVQRPALPLQRADTQRISLALSLIAGLVVGIAGAFAREYMGRSLRSEGDVVRNLGLPLLASIGEMPKV